jgi:predicted dinucleotide-binding enzyme
LTVDSPGRLLIFGLGYTGAAIGLAAAAAGYEVTATSRQPGP